jgi:transcriptional regulator with XRE-family HTH domain
MKSKNLLGPLIKHRRDALRLTQRELASKLGVRASHIAYIENGMRRPSLSVLRKIAATLALDKQKLLLMTYPEVRYLLAKAHQQAPSRRDDAWRAFASDRKLLSTHSITKPELNILRQVSSLGRVTTPRQFIYVLNAIRQALAKI